MKRHDTIVLCLGLAALAATSCCGTSGDGLTASGLDPRRFVAEVDGGTTALYTLRNDAGMEAAITDFGGRLVSLMVPDRDGTLRDVVLGFDNIDSYLNHETDFGASIGRYANRIAGGRFVLDGDTIQLPVNNFGHCLHGGPHGWQYCRYDAEQPDGRTLRLTLHSPDGDQNFPGAVTARVTYTLTDDNALRIDYEATADRATIINMTNHAYFNLSGDPSTEATDHLLYVNASHYTPVDATFMTTGEILPVSGTPMDFTAPRALAEGIDADFDQVRHGRGYDHNWVLDTAGDPSCVAARLTSPRSGITLEVLTTEPGIQIYSGNFLDGTLTGKHGIVYNRRASVCLETQHYPDSPNKPAWPSVVLRPGDTYRSSCTYRFTAE